MNTKITMIPENDKNSQKYEEISFVPCNIIQVEFFCQPIWSNPLLSTLASFHLMLLTLNLSLILSLLMELICLKKE